MSCSGRLQTVNSHHGTHRHCTWQQHPTRCVEWSAICRVVGQAELGGKQNANQATTITEENRPSMARRLVAAGGVALVIVGSCLFAGVAGIAAADERLPPHVVIPGGPDLAGAPVLGVLPGDRDVAVAPVVGVAPRGVDLAGRFIAPVLLALNLSLQPPIRSIWRSSRGARAPTETTVVSQFDQPRGGSAWRTGRTGG